MPKNTTKCVLKALLKRKNAPKWVKTNRNRRKNRLTKGTLLLEREHLANFIIENKLQLSSSVFNKLPKRWFDSHGIARQKRFCSSNTMLQTINTHPMSNK